MGTILASAIVTSARATLLDPTPGKTWTDARFLVMFNEALRRLVLARKELYTVRGPIPLVAGPDQALPAGGTQLFKITRNTTSGRTCTLTHESLLLEMNRFLSSPEDDDVDVDCYSIDPRSSNRFMVSPPSTGGVTVEALYGSTPVIAALTDTIPVDDLYDGPLRRFLLSEAYLADTTRQDLAKSTQYANEAMAMLGVDQQDEANNHPTPARQGGD
jgi:hypothetical protein